METDTSTTDSVVAGRNVIVVWKALLFVVLAVAGLATVLAGALVIDDLSSHTDEFDGLGLFIGGALAAAALVAGAPALVALRVHRRRPTVAFVLTLVLGLLILAASVPITVDGSLWALLATCCGGTLAGASVYLLRK